jgi:hypothetical protein
LDLAEMINKYDLNLEKTNMPSKQGRKEQNNEKSMCTIFYLSIQSTPYY